MLAVSGRKLSECYSFSLDYTSMESSTKSFSGVLHCCLYTTNLHTHTPASIYTVFLCRVTSVNRVLGSQGGDAASSELRVIQLILHLNLNAARLQQILQGSST